MKKQNNITQNAISLRILLLVCLFNYIGFSIKAQDVFNLNRDMQLIAKPTSKAGWIEFRNEEVCRRVDIEMVLWGVEWIRAKPRTFIK